MQSENDHRHDRNIDAREATELHDYENEEDVVVIHPRISNSDDASPSNRFSRWIREPSSTFWKHQISVAVAPDKCRDHLALERTYLSYLRTSLALVNLGVIVCQLLRLQHTKQSDPIIGYFKLGIPLSSTLITTGIVILMFGAYRTWRQQNAMMRGKVHAGGWELISVGALCLLATLAIFVLLIVVDIRKE